MAKKTYEPPEDKGDNNASENAKGTKKTYATPDMKVEDDLNTPSYGSKFKQKDHEEKMNVYDAINFIMRVAGVTREEAVEMEDAIWEWTGTSYTNIRHFQQTGEGNDEIKKFSENVEKYIERAAKWGGGVTYRGVKTFSKDIVIGDTIDMNGTASWSTREGVAKSFSGYKGGIVFVCDTQSKGTSTKFAHQHYMENEVTVSRSAKYVVQSVKINSEGKTYVYVKEA